MHHMSYTPKTSVRTVRPSPRNCPERNKCQNNIHNRLYMHAMDLMQAQPSTHTLLLLQGEQFAHFFADNTGKTCVINNAGFALLCLQQLVLRNVFIRRRQHRLRTPSARVTTSLLIADYSLLNQLVQTGP